MLTMKTARLLFTQHTMERNKDNPDFEKYLQDQIWFDNLVDHYAHFEKADTPEKREKVENWLMGQWIDAKEQGYETPWREHVEDFIDRTKQK